MDKSGASIAMIVASLAPFAVAIPGDIHARSTWALIGLGVVCLVIAAILARLSHLERPVLVLTDTEIIEAYATRPRGDDAWRSEDNSSIPMVPTPYSGAGSASVESLQGWPVPGETERFWFIHLLVENIPRRGDRTATNVRGTLIFKDSTGKDRLRVRARWSSTPQGGDISRTLTSSKINLVAHDPAPLDIAFKGTHDRELYAFHDATYHRPNWRTDPLSERVIVEVEVRGDGVNATTTFTLEARDEHQRPRVFATPSRDGGVSVE